MQFGYPTGPRRWPPRAAEATNASLLDAFNGLLLAIPVLTALAALAALESLPPGAGWSPLRSPACPTWAPRSSPRAPSRRRRWPCSCWPSRWRSAHLGRRAAARATDRALTRAGRCWWRCPVRGRERLRLQPPGAGLVRGRGPDLAGARARHREAAHRRRQAARRGPPPPQGDRRRGAWSWSPWGRFSAAQLSGFVGKVGDVQASVRPAQLAGLPGRGPGVWPEGDFQRRPGRGRAAPTGGGAGAARRPRSAAWRRSGAATSAWWRWAPRRCSCTRGARLFASIYVEAKALAVIAPLVVVAALGALFWPRGCRGRPDGPALRARRGRRRRPGGLDLPGASRRAGRLRPARRRARGPRRPGPGPHGRLPGGGPLRRLLASRHADAKPRRLRAGGGQGPPEEGLAAGAWRWTWTRSRRERLDEFDYAITTTAAYQSTAAAELRDGRPDALLRALAAHRDHPPAAGHRQERDARPRPRLRQRGRGAGWPRAPAPRP